MVLENTPKLKIFPVCSRAKAFAFHREEKKNSNHGEHGVREEKHVFGLLGTLPP
jgi:hypothetical protein